jgi:hypothetical protein
VWQGCTEEQAARGKARYFAACAACDGGLLQRNSGSPELAAAALMTRWGDQPVAALFAVASDSNADRIAWLAKISFTGVRKE